MIPRIFEKDFRLALTKIEKLQLDQNRSTSKGSVGGSRIEDPQCERCEKIVAKIFEDNSLSNVIANTRSEEEKLMQKLEKIDEWPMVEPKPKVESLEAPPRILCQSMLRPYEILQLTKRSMQDAAFDEISCKLMSSPVAEIDKQLLDTYLYPRVEYSLPEAEESDVELAENMAETNLVTDDVLELEEFHKQEFVPHDGPLEAITPLFYRDYSVDLVCEASDCTWKAEHSQPPHCCTDFPGYIEKSTIRGKVLRQLEELQVGLVAPQELVLVPLPPNDTSISSRDTSFGEIQINEANNEPTSTTAISHQTLPRLIKHGTYENRKYKDKFEYFSAAHEKPIEAGPKPKTISLKKDPLDDIPLSVLLQRVRQRSRIEHELRKDSVLKAARHLSKGSCLPPLDLRPRSKTCPPKPCPARKKAPSPPQKAIPCPPQKKIPCPTPKNPCPPPKNPCPPPKNPCPPPKNPCPPPKNPCPPPKNPCPPYKKNPCPPPKKNPCPPPNEPPCPSPKPECPPQPCNPCEPPPPCPPRKKPCGLFTGNRIKETISLILCSLQSTNTSTLLKERNQSTINSLPINSLQTLAIKPTLSASLGLHSMGAKLFSKSIFAKETCKDVDLARSFDPWSPIPSWQMPKKEPERKLVCPKEGCPPSKTVGPCKEQPCNVQRPPRRFSDHDLNSNSQILL